MMRLPAQPDDSLLRQIGESARLPFTPSKETVEAAANARPFTGATSETISVEDALAIYAATSGEVYVQQYVQLERWQTREDYRGYLERHLMRELYERAWADGVSLIGPPRWSYAVNGDYYDPAAIEEGNWVESDIDSLAGAGNTMLIARVRLSCPTRPMLTKAA